MNKTEDVEKGEKWVVENYSHLGPKQCSIRSELSYQQIIWIAQKHGLKVSKKSRSKIATKGAAKRWIDFEKEWDDYNVNPEMFLSSMTPASCYVLGLIWADGHINKDSIRIECLTEDMNHFKNILLETGLWKFYSRKRGSKKEVTLAYTNNRVISSFIKDKKISGSNNEFQNDFCSGLSEELMCNFMLGVIDGDGCFYFNQKHSTRQFVLTGSLKQDWSFFESWLSNNGIKHKTRRVKTKNVGYSQVRITNKLGIEKLGKIIYQKGHYGLHRKYKIYKEIIE